MNEILEAVFSKPNKINIDEQTCEGLLEHFRCKLGVIAESVEKLPETYMKASEDEIINELYNTMYRIQLNDSVDLCVEMMGVVKFKFLPHYKSEIEIIIEKVNLIKSTWDMFHSQYKNTFDKAPEPGNEEMMEDLTSTLFLSNSFIKIVNDTFEQITTGNVRQEKSPEHCEVDSGITATAIGDLLPNDTCLIDIPLVGKDVIGDVTCDVMDAFPVVDSTTGCNNNDILEIAMETIADNLLEPCVNTDLMLQDQNLVADDANMQQDTEMHEQSMPSHGDNEFAQYLTNCSQGNESADCFSRQNELMSKNNFQEEKRFKKADKNCNTQKKTKSGDVIVNYCHSETINSECFSNAFSRYSKVLGDSSFPSILMKEQRGSEELAHLSKEALNYFHPKTKEGVFRAIARVYEYLQEESKWARKLARRNKMGHNLTRRAKIPRPKMTLEVQIYMKLGILPWEYKNRECKPADDSYCKIKIPNEIKTVLLRYRFWYPTMHDKLYCFENHSKYLFDLELFGCWECIRKYFNEIYKWANKNGFVLREVRRY